MKSVFLRTLAVLVACVALPLHAATAIQKELVSIVRPTVGLVGLSSTGELSRSTDGGASWIQVRAADTPATAKAFYALGASGSTVIAMGDAGYFVRSANNGVDLPSPNNWSTLAPSVTAFIGNIYSIAANGTTWVAVGKKDGNSVVLRSTDDGVSWTVSTPPSPSNSRPLYGVTWTGSQWVAVGGTASLGYTATSTDGVTWTASTIRTTVPLYSVSSNGNGSLVVVGEGTALTSSNGTSYSVVGGDLPSEAIRFVTFLSSGSGWIAGTDNGGIVSINGSNATTVVTPTTTTTKAVTALISDGTATGYLYYSEAPAPAPHGPISLSIASVAGQMQLTLVGAQNGYSYQLETSTTLSSWTVVPDSTRVYNSGAAPSWSYELPTTGRVFYRAKSIVAP